VRWLAYARLDFGRNATVPQAFLMLTDGVEKTLAMNSE
jgi:hypothetical protein